MKLQDTLAEGDETFTVALNTLNLRHVVGDSVITDDESPLTPEVPFEKDDHITREGVNGAGVTLLLSAAAQVSATSSGLTDLRPTARRACRRYCRARERPPLAPP